MRKRKLCVESIDMVPINSAHRRIQGGGAKAAHAPMGQRQNQSNQPVFG